MPSAKKRGVLVQMETPNLIPERDLGEMPVLQAEHLGIDFGGLTAVDDFNIAMGRTEISGLIGPNGAGKTTIFNLLTNVYKPTRGTILLDGYDTAGKSVVQVNKMGIARTFQNIRLFNQMSVIENVLVGYGNSMSTHLPTDLFRLPKHWKQEAEFRDYAMDLLGIFNMQHLANEQAGNLPYGAQRRLEILRALATHPKVLLVDEPAAGMNPTETHELMETIRTIRDTFGVTILLIEHDMKL
ncbi:MAG: ABC transporter ATP-binding protein, partial [Coriobacteriales bacterium]|nr:ABC transporter ATP-binding protein [Coriobacteriales bacterium]